MLSKQYLLLKQLIDRLLSTIFVQGEGFCQQLAYINNPQLRVRYISFVFSVKVTIKCPLKAFTLYTATDCLPFRIIKNETLNCVLFVAQYEFPVKRVGEEASGTIEIVIYQWQ